MKLNWSVEHVSKVVKYFNLMGLIPPPTLDTYVKMIKYWKKWRRSKLKFPLKIFIDDSVLVDLLSLTCIRVVVGCERFVAPTT